MTAAMTGSLMPTIPVLVGVRWRSEAISSARHQRAQHDEPGRNQTAP
jgi:hypothetical protein